MCARWPLIMSLASASLQASSIWNVARCVGQYSISATESEERTWQLHFSLMAEAPSNANDQHGQPGDNRSAEGEHSGQPVFRERGADEKDIAYSEGGDHRQADDPYHESEHCSLHS